LEQTLQVSEEKRGQNTEDKGELPLSDPAESNTAEVFRKNEAKTEDEQKTVIRVRKRNNKRTDAEH
jgi:hypothetical protein